MKAELQSLPLPAVQWKNHELHPCSGKLQLWRAQRLAVWVGKMGLGVA